MTKMTVTSVPISQVKPLDRNPRRHSEKQIEALVQSLKQFGQYRPLVVDEEGQILAGNGLYAALLRTEATRVSVYRAIGLSEEQKSKLILADNRTGDMSIDDFDVIEAMLREMSDLDIPGYDAESLRMLIADAEAVADEASQYGVLSPEERAKMQGRSEAIGEANDGQTVGTPPAHPSTCPTCGQPWQ